MARLAGAACDGAAGRAGPDDPGPAGRAPPGLAGRGAAAAGSVAVRGAPLDSVAAIALAVFWSTSSSSDMRAVSAATRPETPSRMSVSRLIVSACLVDSRFRRRSAPSWMAVARAVASSSAFLACDFALASALSDFFLASVVVRSASFLAPVSVFSASFLAPVTRLLRLGARGGDRPFGLFLSRGEHALGLLACLGPDLLRL